MQDEQNEGNIVGLDLTTGEPMDPIQLGVYDSFRVLRNCIASSSGIASNLLLCDELLKARQMVIIISPKLCLLADLIKSNRVGNKVQSMQIHEHLVISNLTASFGFRLTVQEL